MNPMQRLANLSVPAGRVDVVLDSDAYNEVDDQFAIAYLLRSKEKLDVKAIYAAPFFYAGAPFFNRKSTSPADGMERSYQEIQKILRLAGEDVPVLRGSEAFLPDESTPVLSPAAEDLARRAMDHSPERPLYVVAIGAITNVASALLLHPEIKENIVLVWLGSNALHHRDTLEFNLSQDIAAGRVVMGSGVPLVLLPCMGVVSSFTFSGPELQHWLVDKTPLSDYLARNAIATAESYAAEKPWTRVIWDVTAVAWLLNDSNRFMLSRTIPAPLPGYDHHYSLRPDAAPMEYVYHINRDALAEDLIRKITAPAQP